MFIRQGERVSAINVLSIFCNNIPQLIFFSPSRHHSVSHSPPKAEFSTSHISISKPKYYLGRLSNFLFILIALILWYNKMENKNVSKGLIVVVERECLFCSKSYAQRRIGKEVPKVQKIILCPTTLPTESL